MRIQTETGRTAIQLYSPQNRQGGLQVAAGAAIAHPPHDTVELGSVKPRELPPDAISHHVSRLFFSPEVNARLEKVLQDKTAQVEEAAYQLIENNLFKANVDIPDEERAALLEVGLTQAKFLADQYFSGQDAADFMDTIHLLAAVAKTRTVDPATGSVRYADLPQKPVGAPDDYVDTSKLMQRFDPASYKKMQTAPEDGTERISIMLQFVKKLRDQPEWLSEYRKEEQASLDQLKATKLPNRFEQVNTKDLTSFLQELQARIADSTPSYKDPLQANVAAFLRVLSRQP
ncbi:hypothetical protein [Brevibacillus parabrevis]|uniref:hypothetical protein n=1 Tax=Brevibacillus parabrevis TaxID=54914 RepID=UPI000AB44320|nr:hypothetical protein [Brevibacillus parabrevis]